MPTIVNKSISTVFNSQYPFSSSQETSPYFLSRHLPLPIPLPCGFEGLISLQRRPCTWASSTCGLSFPATLWIRETCELSSSSQAQTLCFALSFLIDLIFVYSSFWFARTSVPVQWLRLHAPYAGGPGLISDPQTRSHIPHLRVLMPQLKILHAATKTEAPGCHD